MNSPRMNFIVLTGSKGRMSQALQSACGLQKRSFKLWSESAPDSLKLQTWEGSRGIVDFSTPDVAPKIAELAEKARIPLIVGTTGWAKDLSFESIFAEASKIIPVVCDGNFSFGIEILCRITELLASKINEPLSITDIHHQHKKDIPSGTALKIKKVFEAFSSKKVSIDSIRLGEIFGEHRLLVSFEDETLEFSHRAHSRMPFAFGALKALDWAQKQKPGLYSMKDVLQ